MLDYFDTCSKADKSQLNLLQRTKSEEKSGKKTNMLRKTFSLRVQRVVREEASLWWEHLQMFVKVWFFVQYFETGDDCQLIIDSLLVQDVSVMSLILLLHCCS